MAIKIKPTRKELIVIDFHNLPTPMVEWRGTAEELHKTIFDAWVHSSEKEPVRDASK